MPKHTEPVNMMFLSNKDFLKAGRTLLQSYCQKTCLPCVKYTTERCRNLFAEHQVIQSFTNLESTTVWSSLLVGPPLAGRSHGEVPDILSGGSRPIRLSCGGLTSHSGEPNFVMKPNQNWTPACLRPAESHPHVHSASPAPGGSMLLKESPDSSALAQARLHQQALVILFGSKHGDPKKGQIHVLDPPSRVLTRASTSFYSAGRF